MRICSILREFEKEAALEYRTLWKHFLLLEDHISAPFRQILLNAEANVGPNFGNLDVQSYCGGALYVRTANYLVLKSMVAHWEKKYNDASKLEDIPETNEGMDFMAPQAVSSGPADHIPTCGGKSDRRHGAEDVSDLRQQLGIV